MEIILNAKLILGFTSGIQLILDGGVHFEGILMYSTLLYPILIFSLSVAILALHPPLF